MRVRINPIEANVDPNATVQDVIDQLIEADKIPRGQYQLLYGGRQLGSGERIRDIGIREGEELLISQYW